MTLPDVTDVVHTREAVAWRRGKRTWAFGEWGRASDVRAQGIRAVLLELEGDWSDALAADRESASDHVLTAFERGRLTTEQIAGTPYRSPSVEHEAVRYALLPWIEGCTLAPALARARLGQACPPDVVATLGLEIARGLLTTPQLGALTPNAIVIDVRGSAWVRGPLLTSVVERIGAASTRALAYTAPEALRADGSADDAARLFALGVMLHDLLAGAALFPEGAAGPRAIARWNAPSVERLPAAPHALRSALWLLLQRDPIRRGSPRAIIDLLAPSYAPSAEIATELIGDTRTPLPFFSA